VWLVALLLDKDLMVLVAAMGIPTVALTSQALVFSRSAQPNLVTNLALKIKLPTSKSSLRISRENCTNVSGDSLAKKSIYMILDCFKLIWAC
jgi:hypothetical protein